MFAKLHFALLLLIRSKKKHTAIFVIATLLIFILASTLFISSSIQNDLYKTLATQADFTLQRYRAGHLVDAPVEWIDTALEIEGVKAATGRVYGEHYYEPKEQHFLIIGIDFYDTQMHQDMQKLLKNLDIEEFLSRKNMIIGSGVKAFFDKYHYFNSYTFRPPERSKEKLYIYDTLPQESNLFSSDVILMDINEARKILGIDADHVTDIILSVPNESERQKVYEKLIISHFDTRIITKEDIKRHYQNLFNYKGGLFLTLYIVTLITFLLLLYQRYTMVTTKERQEIALLRSLGWKIDAIIWLKVGENGIIALFAYLFGVILAYIYVYFLDAPLLQAIFLGSDNLRTEASFTPYVNISDLLLLFALFVIPFLLAIIIPLWRLSIEEISETLR